MTAADPPRFPKPDAATLARLQADALATFRRWAADPLTLVVDTETTSLDGDVWEIAAGRLGEPPPLLHLRGAPDTPWHEQALALHPPDILEQLRGRPHLRAYAGEIAQVLGRHHVLAYNEKFDREALNRTCALELAPFGCVMLAYAPLAARWSESRGFWKSVKLQEACTLEGVPVERRTVHSAPGDMWLTSELIRAVARRAGSLRS